MCRSYRWWRRRDHVGGRSTGRGACREWGYVRDLRVVWVSCLCSRLVARLRSRLRRRRCDSLRITFTFGVPRRCGPLGWCCRLRLCLPGRDLDEGERSPIRAGADAEVAGQSRDASGGPEYQGQGRRKAAIALLHGASQIHDRGHSAVERDDAGRGALQAKKAESRRVRCQQHRLPRRDHERGASCAIEPRADLFGQRWRNRAGNLSAFVHRQETSRIENLLDPHLRFVYEQNRKALTDIARQAPRYQPVRAAGCPRSDGPYWARFVPIATSPLMGTYRHQDIEAVRTRCRAASFLRTRASAQPDFHLT